MSTFEIRVSDGTEIGEPGRYVLYLDDGDGVVAVLTEQADDVGGLDLDEATAEAARYVNVDEWERVPLAERPATEGPFGSYAVLRSHSEATS